MKHIVHNLKKLNTLLLLFALMGVSEMGWGQYSGTGTFNKITSLTDLTDGYYVIVNSGDGFAMNNTNGGSYFEHTSITPSSNTITNPGTSIVWKIENNGSGRSIFNEASSKYVSYTGSSNAAYAVDAVTSDAQRWTFTYATDVFTVTNIASNTRMLQYNASSPRFACYTTAQQKFLLYKMAPLAIGAPTATAATNLANTSYTANWGAVSGATSYRLDVS